MIKSQIRTVSFSSFFHSNLKLALLRANSSSHLSSNCLRSSRVYQFKPTRGSNMLEYLPFLKVLSILPISHLKVFSLKLGTYLGINEWKIDEMRSISFSQPLMQNSKGLQAMPQQLRVAMRISLEFDPTTGGSFTEEKRLSKTPPIDQQFKISMNQYNVVHSFTYLIAVLTLSTKIIDFYIGEGLRQTYHLDSIPNQNMSDQPITVKTIAQLPSRRKGGHTQTFKSTRVISNHYFVELKQVEQITIFSVKFTPFIPHDNSQLRNSLLRSVMDQISNDIRRPIASGTNIFSTYDYTGGQLQYQAQDYVIQVKKVKVYDLRSNPTMLLTFLNNTLRSCMRKLNYVEIGKSGKYFNAKEKTPIDSLTMYNGFKSNFVSLEKGFYLRVDAAKKIVRNQTVLEHINDLYKIHRDLEKEERRMAVKAAMNGLVVMSNYGKTNYYTIQDIQFTELENVIFEESKVKLLDYYKDKYKIEIKNLKQPLLVAETREKNKTTLLVPELMLMTGIPQDFDEMRRKKISESTIRPPHEKHKEIGGLMEKLKRVEELSTLEKMGIRVNQNMQEVKAKVIPSPVLELGNKNMVERGKEACFNLFNKPIFASKHDINLGVIYQRGTDIRSVLDTFSKTAVNLGVNLKINKYEADRISVGRIEQQMENSVNQGDNICCIVITNNLKTQYKAIKTIAITKIQLVTQVLTDVKLRNKNLQSIATKVLLQIIAKRGNTLWVPKPTCKLDGCMLVAYDSGKAGNKNVLALCATINSTYSSIFSASSAYDSNQQRFGKMVELLLLAIQAYVQRNNRMPQEIIVFHNSCTNDQVTLFQEFFVEALRKRVAEACQQAMPNLTLVMINVKTSERFFSGDNRGINNVDAGTLVSSDLVSLNYDFYIVSQKSNRGCSVPNHYKVIYSSSQIQEGILQEIAFSQCFNYVNWTGSIKVPAIMQYAKKLAKFNSEVLEPTTIIPESLASKLYYDIRKGQMLKWIIFIGEAEGQIMAKHRFFLLLQAHRPFEKACCDSKLENSVGKIRKESNSFQLEMFYLNKFIGAINCRFVYSRVKQKKEQIDQFGMISDGKKNKIITTRLHCLA